MNRSKESGFKLLLVMCLLIVSCSACKQEVFYLWGINFKLASQYGTFIGGILAFVSVLLIYSSLRQQKEAFEITSFENKFFQLIDYHRKNVENWEYKNPSSVNGEIVTGGKVFICIHREVIKALKILKNDLKINSVKDILNGKEIQKVENLLKDKKIENCRDSIILELELINIAYLIVFVGVSKEGYPIIERLLSKRYEKNKVNKILKRFRQEETKWDKKEWIKNESISDRDKDLKYELRKKNNNHYKFFGGHQHRLGHYYRHMYQTVKYVDGYVSVQFNYLKRYEYIKTYRAQFSNYEQIVFVYNSLSVLGRVWEFNEEDTNKHFVTKYNLIKNILGESISDIDLKMFYPNVKYEGQETSDTREKMEKKYS